MANYIEYDCLSYIESRVDLRAKIIAIDNIIAANETLMLTQTLAPTNGIAMYELDDGQVRIKVNYHSVDELLRTINGLEVIKQRYVQRLNGRTTQLRDRRTFRGFGWGGCGC